MSLSSHNSTNSDGPNPSLTPSKLKTGFVQLAAAIQRPTTPLVLLVDDDDHDSFFFQDALKQAGVTVQFFRLKDGEQAIHYFQGKGRFADRVQFPLPNLTLLDFKMPRISGIEVLEYIRTNPALANLIVIAFTSSGEPGDLEAASRLCVNAYIVKPLKIASLVDIIRHLKLFWLDTISRN